MAQAESKSPPTLPYASNVPLPNFLLRNHNFLLLWAAYGISAMGDHLSEMGLLKLQHALDPHVTDATSRQAVMTFVFMLPFALLGPVCGWIADRLPRRAIMIAADLSRAVIVVGMLSLLMRIQSWINPGHTSDQPMNLSVAVFPMLLVGIFAALFSPARLSLLPTLIRQDQIIRANAMTSGIGVIMTIIATLLGGYLVQTVGVQANFRLNALTFLLSAIFVFFIRPPRQPQLTESEGGLKPLIQGFRYTKQHRAIIEVIFVATVFWIAASIVRSVVPAIVKHFAPDSYSDLGIYHGLLGIGIVLGSITLAVIAPALRNEVAISWSLKLAGLAVGLVALALWRDWPKFFCVIGLIGTGFFGAGVLVSVNAMLQIIVPNYIRGRVFGVMDQCSMAGLLVASGWIGIPHWPNIDQHITWLLALTGIGLIAVGFWTTMARLRRGRFGRAMTFWRNLNEFYCRLIARAKREGLCTIPVTGGAIVAANHNSTLDPFVLTSCSPNRTPGFMIAAEYTKIPIFRWLLETIECVPVTRSGVDTASVKAALRHLSSGKLLGIFPQGRVQRPDEPPLVREGIGMLALRSGAPVIPAYVGGIKYSDSTLGPVFRRHRAYVRFGPPVDLTEFAGREKDRAAYHEASEKIMAAIIALKNEGSSIPGVS